IVRKDSPESITAAIAESLRGKRAIVLAPVFFDAASREEILVQLIKAGYFRAWIDGEVRDIKELDTSAFHSLEIVITRLRIDELPIAPWNSAGYEDCYEDLEKAAKKYRLRLDVPIEKLTAEEWDLLYNGRAKWYGIKGFFEWLETKKYKIHVRVKLAKYRSYE